jgi:hypothetical protein
MSDEVAVEDVLPPHYDIITISLDGDEEPSVDLGNISPYAAITILESVAETLRDLVMPPKVTYKDRVIVNYGYGYAIENGVWDPEDEDDDEDFNLPE